MKLDDNIILKDRKIDDESKEILKELIAEYQPSFEGLTQEQKKLLAYRKILELREKNATLKKIGEKITNKNISPEEYSEYADLWKKEIYHVWAIMEASNCGVGIITSFMIHENDYQEYRDLYQESLISYNRILENYHKLAEELQLSDALEISHLFTYMLWNGYYSANKEHNYKLQSRLLLPSMHSFDVIRGQGVCLAYAELLHNYLTVCNHQSAILDCKVPTNKGAITYDYRPDIVRRQQSSIYGKLTSKTLSVLLKGLINYTGNHAVTLIDDHNKQFIYDPTNLCVLNLLNSNQATLINGQGTYEIKPHFSLVSEPNCDPYHLFEKVLSNELEPALTQKEIIFSFENTLALINSNLNLLNDAYDNIHSDLINIQKQTNEIGGYIKSTIKIRKLKNIS